MGLYDLDLKIETHKLEFKTPQVSSLQFTPVKLYKPQQYNPYKPGSFEWLFENTKTFTKYKQDLDLTVSI